MTMLSQFGGGMPVTKAIVNGFSTNGTTTFGGNVSAAYYYSGCKSTASGSLTANTLKTLLNITGRGAIDLLAIVTADATSRTIRGKLKLDGVVVFDSTSAAIATNSDGIPVIGGGIYVNSGGCTAVPDTTYFNQSLLLEIASSLTETDKLNVLYRYKTF